MDVLFKSIKVKFDADADLVAALSGGLHLEETPDNPVMPYGTADLVSIHPDNTFSEVGEVALFQFKLYDNSRYASVITDIFEKWKSCFDEADMVITGYNHVYMLRESAFLERINGVWQFPIRYRWMIQKSR